MEAFLPYVDDSILVGMEVVLMYTEGLTFIYMKIGSPCMDNLVSVEIVYISSCKDEGLIVYIYGGGGGYVV